MNTRHLILLALLPVLGLAGCINVTISPTPTPMPTSLAAVVPTNTAVPSSTAIPPTATRTVTPSPTATRRPATRTATRTPCPLEIMSPLEWRWTSQLQTRLGCPLDLPYGVSFAMQPFVRGTMYWREQDRRIVVVFGDKTWAQYADSWSSDLPDDSCPGITVPAGLVKPARGFGKIWCEQDNVRVRLGGALGSEVGPYASTAQTFARGAAFAGWSYDVVILFTDNTWDSR